MAEVVTSMLIGPLVSMVKDKVSNYLLDEYKVMEGMEEQRDILERKLPAILDIIQDAEEKAAHRAGVRAWIKALKKVSYQANDIFDEFKYEALAREAKKKGHRPHYNMLGMEVVRLSPVYNAATVFRRRMGKKLQKIVQDIDVLVAEMNAFGFSNGQQTPQSKPYRQTDPVMIDCEKDIVKRSRSKEEDKIVKILLDHGNNDDLLVLPIVSLGGLGKTTFVQLVYSDPKIDKYFQFRKWYCVSEDFDVGDIARSICNSTEKDTEKLLQDLQKELRGKRPRHLQHLRYLDISKNCWIKQLPEEISTLYNLQTLNISHCRKLCRLPRDMKYMASLRHLYTEECESLKGMPPDLGKLNFLMILTYFVVSANSGCSSIGELTNSDLDGKLMLSCLQNVTQAQAQAAALKNKEKLRHLSLEWSGECHEEPVPDCHKKVLDALEPHDGLDMLKIVGYKSTCLPTWMKYLSLLKKQLTELHLVRFTMCGEFPQFSHLEALQILHLEELGELQSLCNDEASLTFLKLKELQLLNLKNMERWVAAEGREGELKFSQLENLIIRGCPKLATLPDTPNLKVVELDEDKAQLSLLIVGRRYISLLSKLELSVRDKEAALELDNENVESPLLELKLSGCNFFFLSSQTQPTVRTWRWFGKLVSLKIYRYGALIYWPEDVFRSLVSLKHLVVDGCGNLVGCALAKGEPAPPSSVLPRLNSLYVCDCDSLAELFVLPPSITEMHISKCKSLKFTWEEEAELKSIHVEQLDTSAPLENCPSTSVPKQSAARTNHPLPCMEYLHIDTCDSLVALPDLPPALRMLNIWSCEKLCFVSGQLDALKHLDISCCNKLQSLDSLGHLPSLESLILWGCKCLTSVPGALGSYSALRTLVIKYCPVVDMKPLYQRHQQRLDNLEHRYLSRAHSSYEACW
ncbi:unnamed protein product [Urochloa decumbens]|uniref:Rx N-terminal domain-containing protein n=1 Tax=Urochloa decumbens TaxID=240449 RepID=A0ABC9BZI5_9POAL